MPSPTAVPKMVSMEALESVPTLPEQSWRILLRVAVLGLVLASVAAGVAGPEAGWVALLAAGLGLADLASLGVLTRRAFGGATLPVLVLLAAFVKFLWLAAIAALVLSYPEQVLAVLVGVSAPILAALTLGLSLGRTNPAPKEVAN